MCSQLVEATFGLMNQDSPPLTQEQKGAACAALVDKSVYPSVRRKHHDKVPASDPKYCLFSFVEAVPACEVKLNGSQEMCPCCVKRRRGQVFGVACVRGTAPTLAKAKAKADKLVGSYDSVHVVQTCHVGRPFPLISRGMADETVTPSAMEAAENALSEKSLEQRKERLRQKLELKKREQEIKERNKRLLQDPKDDPELEQETELEKYATIRIKATCLLENAKKASAQVQEYCASMKKVVETLCEMEAADPTLLENFPTLLTETREKLGISAQDTEKFLEMAGFDSSAAKRALEANNF
ncbi:hypothetical protein LMBV_034 [Largemouth bass virus]|uniref:Uncharacterized protein n=1 Tax=Largemouth bass virus TaxID=176656 RepID=A0A9X7Y3F5_9VIRU|nr:hypothetical protein OA88_22820 [Flavobacterium sp. JRM]QJE49097.1 hypothetical protein LMBV_034 [Largemouth bass virus]QJE49183.1 hypothetical protein LMBV_034 [Largemouth bass virus]